MASMVGTNSVCKVLSIWCLYLLLAMESTQCSVTYDRKAIVINGRRRILFSGSVHYPRSTPDMWEDLIEKAKDGGVDVIETYVFWNGHEPSPGQYNFEERYDLVRFIRTIQRAGLYAFLRLGPYVCAEWNFGGFPVWLKFVPGISFRTDNGPFKRAMQGFTEKIVNLMKSEGLFESQGGPIILSQIENEYGALGKEFGRPGYEYMRWAASMAVGQGTGVPWVMCKEEDAPDPIINTCNGFYCDTFTPNEPYKPTIWTEAWTGWFTEFGGAHHERPVQDLAFAVAQFIQKGGSFVNYYMYHGGTNFGRTAGGPFITTSYDYDAPIDEYGLVRQPKYGHLKELHKAIKLCEQALVTADPTVISLGSLQQAHVYSSGLGGCAAFLSNHDTTSHARVMFNNMHYTLPPWSISILPDCRNVVFNTARVRVQTSQIKMRPTGVKISEWETFVEDVPSLEDSSFVNAQGLFEQLNITRDVSDYLWYTTSINIDPSELSLLGGKPPTLVVQSTGHALHVFINGEHSGSAFGTRRVTRFTYSGAIRIRAGTNRIALLSVAVGLPNVGPHFEQRPTGIVGAVTIHGLEGGEVELTWQKWSYQVGLKGEATGLVSPTGISSVEWTQSELVPKTLSLAWHKAVFDSPNGDEPLALDMKQMGKGEVWINGRSIGRYWSAIATGDCRKHTYVGHFRPSNSEYGCGQLTQRWYHVPKSWLKPTQNLLVVFEELGGNPLRISLVKRSVSSVCASVHEYHPMIASWQIASNEKSQVLQLRRPTVFLQCSRGQLISSIKFASFGTPSGTCGAYILGSCHAPASYTILEEKCIGRQGCSVLVRNSLFGDPCPYVLKQLSVEAVCRPVN